MNSSTIKENLKVYGVVLTLPIFILLCVFAVQGYVSASDEKNQLEQEVDDLRKQVEVFNSNKALVQSDLDSFNNILLSIIPNKEDYFTIILAMEKLSAGTGFTIDKYTIQLDDSTKDKLSISISGTGDANAFLKFLQQYKFQGGRLITNEKMQFSTSNEGDTKLSLNFYNKQIVNNEQKIEPITRKDVNLLRDIQQKVDVEFTNINQSENLDYKTKENPF